MDHSRPPLNGTVIRYAYLRRDEVQRGNLEIRKSRPSAVILARVEPRSGLCYVFVLPITHSPPALLDSAIEVTSKESQAMGLDGEPAWIICSELNQFVWPGFDIRSIPRSNPPTQPME